MGADVWIAFLATLGTQTLAMKLLKTTDMPMFCVWSSASCRYCRYCFLRAAC